MINRLRQALQNGWMRYTRVEGGIIEMLYRPHPIVTLTIVALALWALWTSAVMVLGPISGALFF